MKRISWLVLLLFAGTCMAQTMSVSLEWDASPTPGIEGYMVFDRNFEKPYDYTDPVWIGPELGCTVEVPDDRESAFVARAYKFGPYDLDGHRTLNMSADSNEVSATPVVTPPEPPRNIIVQILVAVLNFFGGLAG